MDLNRLKKDVCDEVDHRSETLRKIAKNIHENPETGWETPKAVAWLTGALEADGFETQTGIADLSCSFTAEWSKQTDPKPVIAIVAEYDALKGMGHGCGHNLIGTAAVGAALALKAAVPDLPARVRVIGTPYEEGGGGKIIMVERGVFEDVDAAMMCHPHCRTMVGRGGLACTPLTFKYHGKPSHASSAPQDGISALDAVLQVFFSINQLRQFAPQKHRIHGIITHGGEAPNIVPEYAEAEFIIRAANRRELEGLKKQVLNIAECAAKTTGARLEVETGLTYAERYENPVYSKAFAENLTAIGTVVEPAVKTQGSSDMGNVGEVCPMIHPYIKVSDCATHSKEFALAAGSEAGMTGMLTAAKALAMTALDLCFNDTLMAAIKADHARYRAKAQGAP
jgi:amidohydrolase